MKNASCVDELTELEDAVLARAASAGPVTAYAMKEVFRASPSSFWSGSAGAVYPLMKRLEERGLLSSVETSETKRPKRVFNVTMTGHAALKVWIMDVKKATNFGYDPLRTRVLFSALLSTEERDAFFTDIEPALHDGKDLEGANEEQAQLHRDWMSGRLSWFEKFRARLKGHKH